ncbi:MAG: mechanosensitive ion channel family protein [Candidatus Aenigmarchaeota archaeon]|nr:mechanosensitive ion channel family protein [Candidatus Aenigmarchaeota archaeon]
MADYLAFIQGIFQSFPTFFYLLLILAVSFAIYKVITAALRRALISKAKTKNQKNNALVFLSIWKYAFTIIIIIGLIFYLGGDIAGLGLWAGLMTAALGWALQKPITGIAGYLLVVIKKPFQIGDRIEIGAVKGDVIDITLTHICLREIGGTIATEEISGRVILLPNSILFEQNIINYTMMDEYILDQVVITVTYDSNLDKAIKICQDAIDKVTQDFGPGMPKPPYIRTYFQPSGIDVKTRYYVKASERIRVVSDLTQEIFRGINRAIDVEFAYPHTEVVLRKKMKKKAR